MYITTADLEAIVQQRKLESMSHEQMALLRLEMGSYAPNTSRRARIKAQILRSLATQPSVAEAQEPVAVAA
jgi:hypothetical protein